jgi:hypothetical protein
LGRAGIEPATHGFSGHAPAFSNASQFNGLAIGDAASAALALQFGPEFGELIEKWPRLSASQRVAIMGIVRGWDPLHKMEGPQ